MMDTVEIACYCHLAILHVRMRENPNLSCRAGRVFCLGVLRLLEGEEGTPVSDGSETG